MSTEIAEQKPGALSAVPTHLQNAAAAKEANELLYQYAAPMRLKIVQKMSRAPLNAEPYKEGDVVLAPNNEIVARLDESFIMTPIFFFPEWIVTNPQGSELWIAERSLDPRSVIAQKARDPNKRKEPVDGSRDKFKTYMEVHHFVVGLHETPTSVGENMVAVMSFMSAELKTGSAFSTLIRSRGSEVPCWGQVYQVASGASSNAKGAWKGYKITNPTTVSPWVEDAAVAAKLEEEHKRQKKAYLENAIIIDMDESVGDGEPTESNQY